MTKLDKLNNPYPYHYPTRPTRQWMFYYQFYNSFYNQTYVIFWCNFLGWNLKVAICDLFFVISLLVELYFNFFSLRVLYSSVRSPIFSFNFLKIWKLNWRIVVIFVGYKNSQIFFKISIFFTESSQIIRPGRLVVFHAVFILHSKK